MAKMLSRKVLYFAFVLMLLVGIGAGGAIHQASAGPKVEGDTSLPDRVLMAPQGGKIQRIVYVATGSKTMAGANTPVAGDAKCGQGSFTLYSAEVVLNGTMTGTAPTLAVKWQHSYDGGTTWHDVGTWTTVNATVTPAVQNQVVSDVYNSTTAVAYGDCWRATYTFGGSGTVTANFSITGFNK